MDIQSLANWAQIISLVVTLVLGVVAVLQWFYPRPDPVVLALRKHRSLVLFMLVGSAFFLLGLRVPRITLSTKSTITANSLPIAVDAAKDWQSTGTIVKEGDEVSVRVVGGKWTTSQGMFPDNIRQQLPDDIQQREIWVNYVRATAGEGSPWRCGDIGLYECPIPEGRMGQLVARIQMEEPIAIGEYKSFVAPNTGMLYLRINDGESEGTEFLEDNAGILAVTVTTNR